MQNNLLKVKNNSKIFFSRQSIPGNGDCGYTAFGITRQAAFNTITTHLFQVQNLIRPAAQEVIITDRFINYLKAAELATSSLLAAYQGYQHAVKENSELVDSAIQQLYRQIDLTVIQAYIDYDIKDKRIDAGWAHPAILYALAEIQGVDLYLWQQEDEQLIPHPYYPHYQPKIVDERNDLLFMNGNHFDVLHKVEQRGAAVASPITLSKISAQLLGKNAQLTPTACVEDANIYGISFKVPSNVSAKAISDIKELATHVLTIASDKNLAIEATTFANHSTISGTVKRFTSAAINIELTEPITSLLELSPYQLPFEKNKDFVGREDILQEVAQRLQQGQCGVITQTVRGLGGIGKSQVAVEYAYRHFEDYHFIGWLNGQTLEQECLQLADRLKIPKDLDSAERIQAAMQQLKACGKWLLIIDDVPDYKAIKSYIPKSSGHVIITTRYTQDWIKPITLKAFTEEESIALLSEILQESSESESDTFKQGALALAKLLGHLPLALAQAGAYIKETGKTIESYIKLFTKRRKDLWKEEVAPADYQKTVAITWDISIEAAKAQAGNQAEALTEVLGYYSYLQPTVPRWLLATLIPDELHFDKIIKALKTYSLLTGETALTLHALVQHVVRDTTIVTSSNVANWLTRLWPQDETATSLRQQRELIPQGEALRMYISKNDNVEIGLLGRMGLSYNHFGQSGIARDVLEQAVAAYELDNNKSLHRIDMILLNLANAYGGLGNAMKKKIILERVLFFQEQYFNKNHPEIATSLISLAGAYGELNHLNKEKALLEEALAIQENHYKKDHPEVAITLTNLANVYGALGNREQQKQLLEQVLITEEAHFGKDHHRVASTLTGLATAYAVLGDINLSRDYFERALTICEKFYGKDHHEVSSILNNLAIVYGELKDFKRKKIFLKRALLIKENYYGNSHPKLISTLNNLAFTYGKLDKIIKKKFLLERSLSIHKINYDENHHSISTILNSLANVYGILGDIKHQKELLEEALKIQVDSYGKEHSNTFIILNNQAKAYGNLGNIQQQILKQVSPEDQIAYYQAHLQSSLHSQNSLQVLANAQSALKAQQTSLQSSAKPKAASENTLPAESSSSMSRSSYSWARGLFQSKPAIEQLLPQRGIITRSQKPNSRQ